MSYTVVVEAGGTKSHAWLVDAELEVKAESRGGGGNQRRVGADGLAHLVRFLVDELVAQAALPLDAITGLSLCAAGIGTDSEAGFVKSALERAGLTMKARVSNDAVAAMEGGLDGEPGVLLIAGTGSIAMGRAADGNEIRCGGWGRELGDEGSGYALGRAVLTRLTWALDGRRHEPDLVYLAIQWLALEDLDALASWVRRNASKPEQVASLAPFVFDLARRGDPRAQHALEEGAMDLAIIARTVSERLDLGPDPLVVLHGGLMQQADYRAKIEAAFKQQYTAARVRLGPPDIALKGGLRLAP